MRFAIVGCGYVADFYLTTLANHPGLELTGVYDRDPGRLAACSSFHHQNRYESLEALLADPRVELVANLTNPSSHFAVSKAALEAGKHVYSEKPLAMVLSEAEALVALAEQKGLLLASAPCSILGETAQTLWKALRDKRVGTPRLVYAEIEDGYMPIRNPGSWRSASGAPWPAKDEFEVGCTLEHAGYYLTWLTAFFGPVRRMTSFSRVLQPDKGIPLDILTPDFATACFEFASGPVARLSCGIYAPHDHRLRIFGDDGTLSINAAWDYAAPVRLSGRGRFWPRVEKYPALALVPGLGPQRVPLVRKSTFKSRGPGSNPMDFCRGIQELADAIAEKRAPRLSARWSLHVNELVLAMQDPIGLGCPREITSSFEPMAPMPWAG